MLACTCQGSTSLRGLSGIFRTRRLFRRHRRCNLELSATVFLACHTAYGCITPPVVDAGALIALHESLLFQRAYPPSSAALRQADRELFAFARRIDRLRASGVDLSPFEDPKVSGIAGTSLSAVFSYEVARQLFARYPQRLAIDWENYERPEKLGPVLRRILPLIEEDWPVEANVPYRTWIAAAARQGPELGWLLDRIAALPLTARDQADLYDSLDLLLVWQIGNVPTSRSCLRLPLRKPFYHREPLLRRADVSLDRELPGRPFRSLASPARRPKRYSASSWIAPPCAIASYTVSLILTSLASSAPKPAAACRSSSSAFPRSGACLCAPITPACSSRTA